MSQLLVRHVQESIDKGRVVEETGPGSSRNGLQTVTLLDALAEFRFEAAIGGARRDEEKAHAKERLLFAPRPVWPVGIPRTNAPNSGVCTTAQGAGRTFPHLSAEQLDGNGCLALYPPRAIPMPSLYFSHEHARSFNRGGMLLAAGEFVERYPQEAPELRTVRFRTIGDMTCTGAVESTAHTIDDVIAEDCRQPGDRARRPRQRRNSRKRPWKMKKTGLFLAAAP